ncbi:MAG TPA: DUF6152 family protein [Terriglobia bacterium]|nr:DUF6152 family protein [Terriglobia bacterium]
MRSLQAATLLGLLLAAGPVAQAHHSFCVQYDTTRSLSFSGKVTRIEWANPHTYIYLDVKDDRGGTQQWIVQASAPVRLMSQNGWTKDTLKAGDELSVRVAPAKDGSRVGGLFELVFKGKTLHQDSHPVC